MGFADQIKAFEQKALLAANNSVSKVVETLFVDVVANSPTAPEANYAKGLLINSYYTSIGGYDLTVGTTTDYRGSASMSRIRATLAQNPFFGRDNVITMTNSVDHAYRAEVLGWQPKGKDATSGWYWTGTVGPYGMVKTAVANLRGSYM